MPLRKGTSEKTKKRNIKEMVRSKPKKGSAREKGIKTMMRKYGMSRKEATVKQAVAAAHSMQRKSKGK
jgi:hypothetical protein